MAAGAQALFRTVDRAPYRWWSRQSIVARAVSHLFDGGSLAREGTRTQVKGMLAQGESPTISTGTSSIYSFEPQKGEYFAPFR